MDKTSFNRFELQTYFKCLREGDRLHIHSMERLAGNLTGFQRNVDSLNALGTKMTWAFTGEDSSMVRLLMQMMGAIALGEF